MTSRLGPSLPHGWTTPPVYARYTVQLGKMLDEKRIAGTHLAPYLRNVDVQWNHVNTTDLPEMDFSAEDRERFSLRSGDLLVCEGGEVGRTALWDGRLSECYFQKAIHRLRPVTENDEPRFFRYFMQLAVHSGLFALFTASTIQHLPAEKLRVVRYPSPPRSQQRAIADYLDRETARVDALVAAKERVLGLLAEKRRALIARAVTRGLDPRAPLRDSGIPWLGDIPLHWRVVQLKFASISLQTGPFGSQLHSEDYVTGGTPVVNPSHLSAGRINADDCVAVDEATANRLALHRLRLGDVVFARRGQMGRCGVVEADNVGWLCGTGSLRARLRLDVVDPYYLALVFAETRISDVLTVQSVGSTMDNLNTEILGSCHVSIPPLTEQRAIVSHIASETTKLDAMRAAIQHTIDLLKERRAALISAAVTGRMQGLS